MAGTLSKDVSLNIIGQIKDYQAAVVQIPGVTEKAAASAALKMQAIFVKQAKDQVKVQTDAANKVVKVQTDAAKQVAGGFSAAFATAARGVQQNQLVSQVETVGSLFIQLGGNVSRVASIFTSAVRPITIVKEILGATGATIAGLVGGGAALAAGLAILDYTIYGLGAKAVSAKEELDKFGVSIGKDQEHQIEAYSAALRDLSINFDKAAVAAGSWVAEDLGALNKGISDAIDLSLKYTSGLRDQSKGQDEVKMAAGTMGDAIQDTTEDLSLLHAAQSAADWATNPFMMSVDALLDKFKDENKASVMATESSQQFATVMTVMGAATTDANKALGDQVQHTKELAQVGQDAATALKNELEAQAALARSRAAEAREAQKYQTALEKFQTLRRKINDNGKKEEDRVLDQEAEYYQELDDIYAKGVISYQEYADAKVSIEKQAQDRIRDIKNKEYYKESDEEIRRWLIEHDRDERELKKKEEAYRNYAFNAAQAVTGAFAAIFDAQAEWDSRRIQSDNDTISQLESNNSDLTQQIKDDRKYLLDYEKKASHTEAETAKYEATKARLYKEEADQKYTEERIKGNKVRLAEDKKLAKQTAVFQRSAAIFSVALNTFQAITEAIATWGPPPNPVAIAGIASASIIGAAQTTAILAQPMPTFFQGTSRVPAAGGSGGEIPATLHRNEAVLNSRAASKLGPEIIDGLNNGSLLQDNDNGTGLDELMLNRWLARQTRRSGAFGNAVRPSPVGFVNPYGRY